MEPTYLTGLVEGLGSFTFSRASGSISLYFAIRLPEVDRPLLEAIQSYFGGGRIYATARGAYFRISRHAELLAVLDHFDRHPLRSHRRDAYALWREMVLLKSRFRHPDRPRLEALALQLAARAQSPGARRETRAPTGRAPTA